MAFELITYSTFFLFSSFLK